MKGFLIRSSGFCEIVDLKEPLHKDLSALVEDSIEVVRGLFLKKPLVMISGDSALINGKPINLLASFFYAAFLYGYPVCGSVVILQEDGCDLVGLTDLQLEALRSLIDFPDENQIF